MERCVSFGPYRFDVQPARLWNGAREVRLTPKASAVLRELVTHAGSPVSKDDLFATVWAGTAVTDDALTSCIRELRRAFEDDPKRPRFIETRHRRGYQFCARLTAVKDAKDVKDDHLAEAVVPARDPGTIAVLPFADMSPAHDQRYLCDGLVEEVINVLTHVDGLRVASRMAASGAQPLTVGMLLEGSVRTADRRLRVTVRLVDATTGLQRWSVRFDRTLDDVFAVQDEIAASVATSLRQTALGGPRKWPRAS